MKRNEMGKNIIIILILLVLTGCAGRDPNPIATMLPGDSTLTCESIDIQIDFCNDEMRRLKPKCNKFATNTVWFLFYIPLMDVKDAEKVEYDAYSRRINYLKAMKINCTDTPGQAVSKRITGYIIQDEGGKKYSIPVYDDGSKGKSRSFVFTNK